MTPTYLVTGGAGFLGSAIVRRLVADGEAVRVLDDASRGRWDRLETVRDRVEVLPGDVRDANVVSAAVAGVRSVLHFAAVNGTEFFYSKPDVVLDVGIGGTLNVVRACAAAKDVDLFLASSSEVYQTPSRVPTDEAVPLVVPDPLEPRYSYGGSKIASELIALNFGRRSIRRVVVVRPHNVYGPDMGTEHVIPQLARRVQSVLATSDERRVPLHIQGTGSETRAFIYVDDFVDAMMTLMTGAEHMGIYNVGTEDEVRIDQVATEIAHYFGREVELIPGPKASGGTPRRCPDTAKLRALGFTPRVPLREGIARTVAWYATLARASQESPVA